MRSDYPPILPAALAAIGLLALCLTPAHAGVTTRVSVASYGPLGNDNSRFPSISANGRYVAFESGASNLVPGDTNGQGDIFVRDRLSGQTSRVSVHSDGTQANGWSEHASISADGRYVAFHSAASNLVDDDTNGKWDVFVHDRQTGETTCVSVDSYGGQGDDLSCNPSISADGRCVAFESDASNLVPDSNGSRDIFVHDRQTGETTRVSVASDATQTNSWSASASISGDGRCVAFQSAATNLVAGDTNSVPDVFVHDRQREGTTRVSVDSYGGQADGTSEYPYISADGRYVAFQSDATNLVAGDTNGARDVFVHDRDVDEDGVYDEPGEVATTRVSVASGGTQGSSWSDYASISADGRYVAFTAAASDLVPEDTNGYQDVFVHDRQTGQTTRVSVDSDGGQGNGGSGGPYISGDGRYVAFESYATNLVDDDTNGRRDVFVHDRQTGETTCVSVASEGNGSSNEPAISGDGRYVAFQSDASNLVMDPLADTNNCRDIFVRDRRTCETARVSVANGPYEANGYCQVPSITADGRYVAFESHATNLVADDNNNCRDIFVHDREAHYTTRVSLDSYGNEPNNTSQRASYSADGRYIAFESYASNLDLVTPDTNGSRDIFVRDRYTPETTRESLHWTGGQTNDASFNCSISAHGMHVAFASHASDVVEEDTNGVRDIFVRDREAERNIRVSVSSNGGQANDASLNASISADGRFVAFESHATHLVAGDNNGYRDIFVRDRDTDEDGIYDENEDGAVATTRVSLASDDAEADSTSTNASISADGRYVAFESMATNLVPGDTNGAYDIFVRDRDADEDGIYDEHEPGAVATTRVSVASGGTQANAGSYQPSISADGRCVAFHSNATNLVPGDTNGTSDVFVHAQWGAAVCCFSYDPPAPDDQAPVQFTDCSTHPDGQVVAWQWDFGDGGSSTQQNPVHLFAVGTYTVCLTVTDDWVPPESSTCCQTVTVTHVNLPPTCSLTYQPASPSPGATVEFDSAASDPDGEVASVTWDFGDGGTGSGETAAHQYAAGGDYLVSVTVCDDQDACVTCEATVTVAWQPPQCGFTHDPASPLTQEPVQFIDQSIDPDGTVVAWSWEFGDGGMSTDQHPTHTYISGGCFQAALTVTDLQGLSSTCSTCVPVRSDTEVPFCDAGWHMVAQPHSGDHALADITVRDDWNILTLAFCDATTAGWVQNPLFYYDIELAGYGLCGCTGQPPPTTEHTMRMGYGYWLYTFEPYLTLVFP